MFPSNRKLMERLNGMPESTLRRHLASLAEIGIVTRKNSPNRKRYARRAGEGALMAFGFDLSPSPVTQPRFLMRHWRPRPVPSIWPKCVKPWRFCARI